MIDQIDLWQMIDQFDLFVGYYTACSFRGFLPNVSSICAPPASLSVIIFFVQELSLWNSITYSFGLVAFSIFLRNRLKDFFSFIFVDLKNGNPKSCK